jgi:LacI family transcriptional regulator
MVDVLPPAWLAQWRGDGIVSHTSNGTQAKMLRAIKLPRVELFGDPRTGTADVICDDAALGRMAVEHFTNCGLRHFGYFTYGEAWWTQAHREGFCRAVQTLGRECHVYQPPPDSKHRPFPIWQEEQRPMTIEWIRSLPRPIGIYAASDLQALRLLDVCRDLDIAVPEEIAVLGNYNEQPLCEIVRPTLSSIDNNIQQIGYEAARLLGQLMAGKRASNEVVAVAPSHVAVRQSTDLIAVEDADVAQAIRFIHESACSGIDVDQVTEAVGLSRSILQRRFLKYLKRTPKAEIMRVRIEHAKVLLEKMEQTGESVARRSGFASQSYFTRAFCREVGMTPQAYRRMRRTSRETV